ncbi:uncharacterized protein LOC135641343 [Musa acuminata AAA Group]|uniref:uncharacterized protein LOC135641343 n=1 Tax=Musa acuminata AAA Group TaxID=214697 RepID=UPI0031E30F04
MPFSLKNAGATYQRMVDKLFKHQIRRNMEVYVDDMIVKSKVARTHLADLAETFQTLKWFNMHLSTAKCIFGVSSGRFLGFIIHQWGIDTNPEKVFVLHLGDKCLLFFWALRWANNFTWTPECEEAFKKLKACLARLPRLASLEPSETLGLYLAASILSNFDASGRMLRWPVELNEFDIQYSPRTAIKAQAPADFISELTPEDHAVGRENNQSTWTLHVDSSSTFGATGVRLILKGPSGETYERSLQLKLYRRAFSQPLIRCLAPPEAETILTELYEGGLDLLGPFPPALGQRCYLIFGVDYFTKWVEVKPLVSITEKQVQNFTWKNINTRFRISKAIITNNGTQFNNTKFKAYCQSYGIQLKFSSIVHSQTNDQAKVMNRAILEGLKKRILVAHGAWVDELPSILWAMQTIPKTTSGESPFNLAFGTKAVLLPEMLFPTMRTSNYEQGDSVDGL